MSRAKVQDRSLVNSSSVNQPSPKSRDKKSTRTPPSVRQREKAPAKNARQDATVQSHTQPVVSAKYRHQLESPDFADALVSKFQSLIDARNWSALGDLIEELTTNGVAIGHAPLAVHPVVNDFRLRAAIEVLMAAVPRCGEQISLALDLLAIGADWNAQDEHGNTVLNILRSEMDPQVQQFIATEFPGFRHLFIDSRGQPIPARIKRLGEGQVTGSE